ncbi:hypothetical protein V5O48_001333 [Marasmius crinis-equi]|uniref:Uncharacterized protein n=1 Tax=Marasmius crinis-equi TaxID=585013 RepID=A0ABR3FYT6_9AGAR
MRVWAIWARSRYICYGLLMLTIAFASLCIVTIAKVPVSQDTFGADLNAAYGVCPPYFAGSNAITTCYVVLVSYESVLLTLTLAKAISLYRHLAGGTSNFVNIFFKDGLSYNGMILACSTANIIVRYRTAGTEYINLLTAFQPVIHSVLTSRMMLHLKQDAINNNSTSRRTNQLPSTHLRFAVAPQRPRGQPPSDSLDDSLFDDSLPSVDHARSWFGEEMRGPESEEYEREG